MPGTEAALGELVSAIAAGDEPTVSRLLRTAPGLATTPFATGATRQRPAPSFLSAIRHLVYAGDTPLHVAAATHRGAIVRTLIQHGADVSARNRRGAQPLHYAVDGTPGSPTWDPAAQADTVVALLRAGADPNATDKNGAGPLHRAVRNRCSPAVAALLEGGADPGRPNEHGSTPLQLARWTTGRGGSGSAAAKSQQEQILRLLRTFACERPSDPPRSGPSAGRRPGSPAQSQPSRPSSFRPSGVSSAGAVRCSSTRRGSPGNA